MLNAVYNLYSGGGVGVNVPGPVTSSEQGASRPVFISYATADRKEALSVCKAIERRGTHCWISCRDVAPGENYQEEIVHSIRQARAMVLVFSEAANNSDEIKKELSLASRYHVPVMALRIEDVEPSDAFAYELSTRQWIDAFQGWDHSIDALVKKLKLVTGDPTTPSSSILPRPRPWKLKRNGLVAALLAGFVILGFAAFHFWNPLGAKRQLTVQIGDFHALAGVPAETSLAFQQELRAAFGDENAVAVKDKDATYKLGGSIRNLGDKIQYSVTLTDAKTGDMVWSATPKGDPARSGALLPQQIAQKISWVVRCGLADTMEGPGSVPGRALTLYLQHCQFSRWGDGDANRRFDVINQVVSLAPEFSKGWSTLADDAAAAAAQSPPDKKAKLLETGKEAVVRSLKLDPENAQAYVAAADLLPTTDWAGRERLYLRAVGAHNSDCGCERQHYGSFLITVGRPTEAVAQVERALDAIPRSPSAYFWLIVAEFQKGDAVNGGRILADYSEFWHGTVGAQNLQLFKAIWTKDWKGAAAVTNQVPEKFITSQTKAAMDEGFDALASRDANRIKRAADAIAGLPEGSDFNGSLIMLLAQLGSRDEAFARLGKEASGNGGHQDADFLMDPALAPLRFDPRWVMMMKDIGVIDYWRKSKKPPEFCKTANAPPFCKKL